MNTYLVIITTALVITQIIRITQNAINLLRQNKLVKAQLAELDGVGHEDIENRRKADRLIIEYLENQKATRED
jgi:hypothetical protein